MSWVREPNAEPIPGYRLVEPIGSGGFGEVWKCEAPGGLDKAIKIVYGNLNSLDVDGARAEQELRALQRVKEVRHPFICTLERIEIVEGELVIVMELAERTLHDLFVEYKASGLIGIPRDELLRYMRDAAEALDYMNERHNLQHLDIKPRNLFLIGDRTKVADFGLVKHLERQTASGLLGGVTPLYAPPETFNGKVSEHSDQYSLAIVYQEMLTGQRPFTGKNVRQLAQAHLSGEPDLRALPESERPVIARALEKDPKKRFSSCMTFIASLYRARTMKAEPAGPSPKPGAKRPKTMAETMEDIHLESYESKLDEAVDFGDPESVAEAAISEMGMTIAAPETGSLRPTLIIGVGGFGRKALLELRCRFLDRFSDLSQLPLLRFLCIDPDPEAVHTAIRGAPDVALNRHEVYHLPLQPVGNYRRRMVESLEDWLPREKLYAIPRSLQTQGSRALGRLAFSDNHQRLAARLRREIQEITDADVLYRSVTNTGLALRDNTPRVYVIGATGGGSSGLLPDLGFAVRRLLDQLRHPDAKVTLHLFCGAPSDPATPKQELANTYATLTELNHFSDATIPFSAVYGTEGQRIIDDGPPFHSCYVLPVENRSPEAVDDMLAHLGNYLFHELTTPLGIRLEHSRERNIEDSIAPPAGQFALPVRSFGTYSVWFPRGLLLRLASRHACRKLIDQWLVQGDNKLAPQVVEQINLHSSRATNDPNLKSEALAQAIEDAAQASPITELGETPRQVLTGLLAHLQEQSLQSVAQEDPGNWANQALHRVQEWVGAGDERSFNSHDFRKTRLHRALTLAAQNVAEEWDEKLAESMFALMDYPGARLAAAEACLQKLVSFCHKAAHDQCTMIQQQAQRTTQAWNEMQSALQMCVADTGGFRWFGGRSRARQMRAFIECLSHYARQRLQEEVLEGVRHFFAALKGRLAERERDFGFCRQRLRHVQENLESGNPLDDDDGLYDHTPSNSPLPSTESFWEAIRQSKTARIVLPDNEEDLERAALRFLRRLHPEHWNHLDEEVHERLLIPLGGLYRACLQAGDLTKSLTSPLLDETSNLLSEQLPIMDVSQILGQEFGIGSLESVMQAKDLAANTQLETQAREYLERATPLIGDDKLGKQSKFLLVPASPNGKALGEAVCRIIPDITIVTVPGQSDLMFCYDQSVVTVDKIDKLLKMCRAAYQATAGTPPTSPHARFDFVDWLPLDP